MGLGEAPDDVQIRARHASDGVGGAVDGAQHLCVVPVVTGFGVH
jgi:hypothetical protein